MPKVLVPRFHFKKQGGEETKVQGPMTVSGRARQGHQSLLSHSALPWLPDDDEKWG